MKKIVLAILYLTSLKLVAEPEVRRPPSVMNPYTYNPEELIILDNIGSDPNECNKELVRATTLLSFRRFEYRRFPAETSRLSIIYGHGLPGLPVGTSVLDAAESLKGKNVFVASCFAASRSSEPGSMSRIEHLAKECPGKNFYGMRGTTTSNHEPSVSKLHMACADRPSSTFMGERDSMYVATCDRNGNMRTQPVYLENFRNAFFKKSTIFYTTGMEPQAPRDLVKGPSIRTSGIDLGYCADPPPVFRRERMNLPINGMPSYGYNSTAMNIGASLGARLVADKVLLPALDSCYDRASTERVRERLAQVKKEQEEALKIRKEDGLGMSILKSLANAGCNMQFR